MFLLLFLYFIIITHHNLLSLVATTHYWISDYPKSCYSCEKSTNKCPTLEVYVANGLTQ